MTQPQTIVFVCEHGAAKSIIAAAYFNKLAVETGLELRAVARGTNPDNELSQSAIIGLSKDGLTAAETVPRKLSVTDVESAQRMVSFCELPEEYQKETIIEQWDNIPPVSESYEKARDAIVEKINELIRNIA